MKEIWKDIPGTDGFYQASNMGRIRRSRPGNRTRIGNILKTSNKGRYQKVTLSINGKRYYPTVHKLISLAFIGPANGLEVNHKNGDRHDNRAENLEYVTGAENCAHSIEVLNRWPDNKGEKHGMSKLTRKEVVEIRRLWSTGKYLPAELGDMYDVAPRTIRDIVNHRSWRHI